MPIVASDVADLAKETGLSEAVMRTALRACLRRIAADIDECTESLERSDPDIGYAARIFSYRLRSTAFCLMTRLPS